MGAIANSTVHSCGACFFESANWVSTQVDKVLGQLPSSGQENVRYLGRKWTPRCNLAMSSVCLGYVFICVGKYYRLAQEKINKPQWKSEGDPLSKKFENWKNEAVHISRDQDSESKSNWNSAGEKLGKEIKAWEEIPGQYDRYVKQLKDKEARKSSLRTYIVVSLVFYSLFISYAE